MIIFRNPGLIDLDAVRTMGVNVKERPGAFGHFGTGLKYAIAAVLRGGGTVTLMRGGGETHFFGVEARIIRGTLFNIVQMDGVDMGFTDQLGRNWEPWMVLRELGCNALDEGGFMELTNDVEPPGPDETVFVVEWLELDEVWAERGTIFCVAEDYAQLMTTDKVQVLFGSSQYLFYRGIRAYRLQHPSVVTYNILSDQTLTEDRTIASFHFPMGEIRRMWLESDDKDLLRQVLAPDGECFERTINYLQTSTEPTREFLDTVLDLRDSKNDKVNIVESATELLRRHLRKSQPTGVGYVSSRFMQDEFSSAIEAIGEIFSEDELELDRDLPLVLVDDEEIEQGGLVELEDDRIYVGRGLLRKGRREIVAALLPLILEVRLGELQYTSEWAKIIVPVLMRNHPDLRQRDPRLKSLDAIAEREPGMEHEDVADMFDPSGDEREKHKISVADDLPF
jgi:hypothetical protein